MALRKFQDDDRIESPEEAAASFRGRRGVIVDYKKKRKDYLAVGFAEGRTLFTTRDDDRGGLDAHEIQSVAEKIKALVP